MFPILHKYIGLIRIKTWDTSAVLGRTQEYVRQSECEHMMDGTGRENTGAVKLRFKEE